jgi:hypothetical protein
MPADPLRLLSFCRAIEEASDDGLLMLDRESLLAVHKSLTTVKEEIERTLLRFPLSDIRSLN